MLHLLARGKWYQSLEVPRTWVENEQKKSKWYATDKDRTKATTAEERDP
jgi:hypothetical protein